MLFGQGELDFNFSYSSRRTRAMIKRSVIDAIASLPPWMESRGKACEVKILVGPQLRSDGILPFKPQYGKRHVLYKVALKFNPNELEPRRLYAFNRYVKSVVDALIDAQIKHLLAIVPHVLFWSDIEPRASSEEGLQMIRNGQI